MNDHFQLIYSQTLCAPAMHDESSLGTKIVSLILIPGEPLSVFLSEAKDGILDLVHLIPLTQCIP